MVKHIVIVNSHWNNRGDEAALMELLRSLSMLSKVKITVLMKNEGEIYGFPFSDTIHAMNAKFKITLHEFRRYLRHPSEICDTNLIRTYSSVKAADAVIYAPGGSVICDRFFWSKQLEYLFPIACAKKYKKPVYAAAPSFGPFSSRHVLRRQLLSYCRTIYVREHWSYENLMKIGISAPVCKAVDLAFTSDIDEKKSRKMFLKYKDGSNLLNWLYRKKDVIGITVTDFSWHVVYGKNERFWKQRISEACREIIHYLQNKGYRILLIPQLFGNETDTELLKEFQRENTMLLSHEYDSEMQQYVISQLYAVVGMRYHSNIFAAKVGTPFVPIVYEEKMQGFLDETRICKYAVSLSNLSVDLLKEKFEMLAENYHEYQSYLLEMHNLWKEKARNALMELNRSLEDK